MQVTHTDRNRVCTPTCWQALAASPSHVPLAHHYSRGSVTSQEARLWRALRQLPCDLLNTLLHTIPAEGSQQEAGGGLFGDTWQHFSPKPCSPAVTAKEVLPASQEPSLDLWRSLLQMAPHPAEHKYTCEQVRPTSHLRTVRARCRPRFLLIF